MMPPNLTWIERLGGRKFILSMLCIFAGGAVTVAGMILAIRKPEIAPQLVLFVGSFSTVLMVAVSLFAASNAAVTAIDRWKQVSAVTTETESSERVRETGAFPSTVERRESSKVTSPTAVPLTVATPTPPVVVAGVAAQKRDAENGIEDSGKVEQFFND